MDTNNLKEVDTNDIGKVAFRNAPVNLLTVQEVCAKLHISRSQYFKTRKSEGFPKPRQITTKRIGWIESEIDAWIISRPVVI